MHGLIVVLHQFMKPVSPGVGVVAEQSFPVFFAGVLNPLKIGVVSASENRLSCTKLEGYWPPRTEHRFDRCQVLVLTRKLPLNLRVVVLMSTLTRAPHAEQVSLTSSPGFPYFDPRVVLFAEFLFHHLLVMQASPEREPLPSHLGEQRGLLCTV